MKNTKKNILIDYRPLQNFRYNGVCISQKHLLTEFHRRFGKKSNITFFTCGIKKKQIGIKNIKQKHLYLPNFILNILFLLNFKIDKIIGIKFDIYYCPDLRNANLSKNIKKIQYIHDLAFIKFKKTLSLKSKINYLITRPLKNINNSNLILTNSNFSKTEIKNEFKNKIKVIKIGLNYKKVKNNKQKENFIMIQTLQNRKYFEKIKEFNLLNKQKEQIDIYGKFDRSFKRANINYKNIKYKGILNEDKKIETISKYKALLYFSHYEGFGMPILEASIAKTKIISNKCKAFKKIWGKKINYIEELSNLNNLKKSNKIQNKNQLKLSARRLHKILQNT